VITLPIKKRIRTELFIDTTAALFIQNGRFKNMVRVVNHWWLVMVDPLSEYKVCKRCRNEKNYFNVVMGAGQNFFTWVGSIFVARIGSGQRVWIWKISPKNVKFFNFFPFWVGSKVPGSKAGQLLFSADQK